MPENHEPRSQLPVATTTEPTQKESAAAQVMTNAATVSDHAGNRARALATSLSLLVAELRRPDFDATMIVRRGRSVAVVWVQLQELMSQGEALIMPLLQVLE